MHFFSHYWPISRILFKGELINGTNDVKSKWVLLWIEGEFDLNVEESWDLVKENFIVLGVEIILYAATKLCYIEMVILVTFLIK